MKCDFPSSPAPLKTALVLNFGVAVNSSNRLEVRPDGRNNRIAFRARRLPAKGGEAYGKDHWREAPLMTDEAPNPQGGQQAYQVTAMRRRLLIALAAAVVLIGGGWLTLWATGGSSTLAPVPHPSAVSAASRRPSDELLETTKGLQVTQQQAVDQLQVVQDQLVAERAEMKKLSEQMAAVSEKLDALQRSIADIPAPPVAAPVSPPKPRHQ
jgi:uncharacterized coiled-coil protein SlyX